jgi:protein-S-isoprenylcysteine O-methyltransferase Ste14
LGRRTLDCSTKKGGSEGGKNKDKDTVMVKLIIQKKKERKTPGKATTKSSVCLLKFCSYSFGVQSWYYSWYSGLHGKGCCLLLDSVGWRWLEVFSFLFFFFQLSLSYGPSITNRNSDVVSPGDWVVSSIWFLLSTGQVAIGA